MHGLEIVAAVLCVAVGVAAGMGESLCTGPLQRVATGFKFTEGPMWHPDGYLVFSDIPANTIYRLTEDGAEVFRKPSGNSNGLTFDLKGRLLACEHGNRRVSRARGDGEVVAVATHYEGKRLNSPNDLVVRSDGSIYFTDPPYGVQKEDRELDFQGVYRVDPKGNLTLLVTGFAKPNGLAFSPDEKVLYIADTQKNHVRAFDMTEDGLLEDGRVFVETEEPDRLGADGMKVDVRGNLYVTATDGVRIYSPKGEHLETIEMPQRPANLCFGPPEGKTLYITAQSSVYKVAVRNPGAVYTRRFAQDGE
jgi:gluconolactonase